MKKVVLRFDLHKYDDEAKRKAMRKVTTLLAAPGVDLISMDTKDKKLRKVVLELDVHDDKAQRKAMKKEMVLKLDLHNDKEKWKAMKKVFALRGTDLISMDTKDKKLRNVVLKLDLPDDKAKSKAMKKVSTLPGIRSLTMDMKKNELMKVVLKLGLHEHDDEAKWKVMKKVSTLRGIYSIALGMKDKKLTVVGNVDQADVERKLGDVWHAEILTVKPAKVPETKKNYGFLKALFLKVLLTVTRVVGGPALEGLVECVVSLWSIKVNRAPEDSTEILACL